MNGIKLRIYASYAQLPKMKEIQALNTKIRELLKCNTYSFELLEKIEIEIRNSSKEVSPPILDLIKLNLNNRDIKSLNAILNILFSTYNFDGEIEQKISIELTKTLSKLTQYYHELETPEIETSYYLIFDIFFHNLGLIEELNQIHKDDLINEIEKISKLKYSSEKSSSSDLLIALQKIIDIPFYFGEKQGKEILEKNFLNHFDKFIVSCAKDEIKINCA